MAELIREIVIDARPETVFPFLSDPDKMALWQGPTELDPRPGGTYRVLMAGQYEAAGEVVEIVPNERIVFTHGWNQPGHPIPPGSTRVEITLQAEGDKTRVRLVHSGLPADAVSDHTKGWDHYLERLSIVVTGGDPGPDQMADEG